MSEKVNIVLNKIINLFENGDVPAIISKVMFPPDGLPSSKWSLSNRIIMLISGTDDARGFKQWNQVGRHVKKGSKAIYILAPMIKKYTVEDTEGKTEDKTYISGFKPVPVFRSEDTDGKDIDRLDLVLPDHPLMDVAKAWGVDVKPIAGNHSYYGYVTHDCKNMRLATADEQTFFHELMHVADITANKRLKTDKEPAKETRARMEVIAQLGAEVLQRMVGIETPNTGYTFKYIQSWANAGNKEATQISVAKACLSVLKEVEKALNRVFECAEQIKVDEIETTSTPLSMQSSIEVVNA